MNVELKELEKNHNLTKEQGNRKFEIIERISEIEEPLMSYKKTQIRDLDKAKEFELLGFKSLLEREINSAIVYFTKSENAYNSYHQVYEISRFLKNKRPLIEKK